MFDEEMVVILGPLEDTAPTFTFIGAITAVSAYNQRLIKDPPRLVFVAFPKKTICNKQEWKLSPLLALWILSSKGSCCFC